MGVVIFVAADARQWGAFKGQLLMAGFAAGDRMLADQREAAQVVIEAHIGAEGLFVVALIAAGAELTGVNIFAAVAADTGGLQFFAQLTFVAALATGLGVFAS